MAKELSFKTMFNFPGVPDEAKTMTLELVKTGNTLHEDTCNLLKVDTKAKPVLLKDSTETFCYCVELALVSGWQADFSTRSLHKLLQTIKDLIPAGDKLNYVKGKHFLQVEPSFNRVFYALNRVSTNKDELIGRELTDSERQSEYFTDAIETVRTSAFKLLEDTLEEVDWVKDLSDQVESVPGKKIIFLANFTPFLAKLWGVGEPLGTGNHTGAQADFEFLEKKYHTGVTELRQLYVVNESLFAFIKTKKLLTVREHAFVENPHQGFTEIVRFLKEDNFSLPLTTVVEMASELS